jgi:type I restriction enzyme M protein
MEMLQTEGKAALKQVDPNLVLKKKDGKEVEVQEGWIGRILPFELVQKAYLNDQLTALQSKENRLNDITGELETLLGELSEEDKACDAVNEAGDAFVGKEIAKVLKTAEGELKNVLNQAQKLLKEEKELKKQIKDDTAALHLETKAFIENLSDEQAQHLQKIKWINPLVTQLNALPEQLINQLSQQVQTLADKYGETLLEIEQKLQASKQQLAQMLTQLHGSPSDMLGASALQAVLNR